jgi:hypothetical protein
LSNLIRPGYFPQPGASGVNSFYNYTAKDVFCAKKNPGAYEQITELIEMLLISNS